MFGRSETLTLTRALTRVPFSFQLCGLVAADEGRHEIAYQRIVDELFKRDEEGAMLAFADMMRKQIVMPAHMMDDGQHHKRTGRELFADYSSVAERTGVCACPARARARCVRALTLSLRRALPYRHAVRLLRHHGSPEQALGD